MHSATQKMPAAVSQTSSRPAIKNAMCGRFAITLPPDAIAQLFAAVPANDLPPVPNYNVCPTNRVHAVVAGEPAAGLWRCAGASFRTGTRRPSDGPLLINARAESIAEKPAFRAAARERRCLVPADGFYEWTKDEAGNRLPWFFRRADGEPLAFAGVWQDWEREGERLTTCALVTTEAEGSLTRIHHRVPVIVRPEDHALWLGEAGKGAALLMKSPAEGELDFFRVDPRVNSNRAAGPELIEPLAA
jgi:putative SOS response-associated peptidase YedK